MTGVCRVGDIGTGTCPNHATPEDYTTVFSTGAENVTTNERSTCFVSSVGIASCGHPTVALTGSELATANGLGLHRVGDVGANYGNYVAITGSENVTSE